MSDVFWAAFGGGAAAGTVTLVAVLAAEWFRWFLDRPLLTVTASFGFIVEPGSESGPRLLLLEARNPHSRPVMVSGFGLSYKSKKWGQLVVMPVEYPFPYQIDGGRVLTQWTPRSTLLETLRKAEREPSDLKWVWFRSSAGKEFRATVTPAVIQELMEALDSQGDP